MKCALCEYIRCIFVVVFVYAMQNCALAQQADRAFQRNDIYEVERVWS